MNVTIVNQWFPPFSSGGVAQYNEQLAKGLVDLGHSVSVVSSLVGGAEERRVENGIHVYRIPMWMPSSYFWRAPGLGRQARFVRNLRYSKTIAILLKSLVQKHKTDLVEYADINGEGFYHRKYLADIPYVVRCHTPYYLLEKTYEPGELSFSCKFINWMERKAIISANAVTAPSHDLAGKIDDWCAFKHGTVERIPNIIDTNWFQPDPHYVPGDLIKVLFVGRMERAKGIYVLADAISRVVNVAKQVKFVFAGGPRSDEGLRKFREYLEMKRSNGYCEIVGRVRKEDLPQVYQRCDIFVNPSTIYESFSYTNAEAMSCGKPVVTSDIGGMPEKVGDGVGGLVFRGSDSVDLAEKLIALIVDEDTRSQMGRRARERSLNYARRRVVGETASLYERMLIKNQVEVKV